MLLVYENKDKGISAEWKKTVHMPPHLHEAIEVVFFMSQMEILHLESEWSCITWTKVILR